MAEWSIAAVLKTVEGNTSGGSNPSLSAKRKLFKFPLFLFVWASPRAVIAQHLEDNVERDVSAKIDVIVVSAKPIKSTVVSVIKSLFQCAYICICATLHQ